MRHFFALLLIISIAGAGCSKVPVIGRSQFTAISDEQLAAVSKQQYDSIIAASTIVRGTSEASMVSSAGARLSKGTEAILREEGLEDRIKNLEWEYNLIQSPEVNAWCMAGGKIAFYTGIMPICQDEKGVAVVMGHEIAHAVAQHGNERVSEMLVAQLGLAALDIALQQKPQLTRTIVLQAFGIGSELTILAFSRKQETEADKLGLIFMAKSGYDPTAAISFWQRMAAQGGSSNVPVFLRTHPTNEQRIKDIQAYLPKAMKYYTQQ